MFVVRMLAVLALTVLEACGDCLSIGGIGIQVTVQDAITVKAPKSAVVATITDDGYEEILRANGSQDPPLFLGASEREGRYQLRVEAAGYQTVVLNNLHVRREGKCGYLQAVVLTVNLVPLP
jgi:hypothetical protein